MGDNSVRELSIHFLLLEKLRDEFRRFFDFSGTEKPFLDCQGIISLRRSENKKVAFGEESDFVFDTGSKRNAIMPLLIWPVL